MNRPRRQAHRAGLALILLVAAGCGTETPSDSPVTAPAGAPSEACPDVNLRSPSGEHLNLTGTWLADDLGDYFMTQRASCLHWLGMSPALVGYASGDFWTNVYAGHVGNDFSVDGAWADVPYAYIDDAGRLGSGELTLQIGFFDDDAGREWPTLHLLEQRGGGGGFGGEEWVPTGAMPERAEYVGTYGYEDGCASLTVDGDRYEIIGVELVYPIADQGQIIGDGSQVLARPGDELRILGQVWPTEDTDACLPGKLLVWDLAPAP